MHSEIVLWDNPNSSPMKLILLIKNVANVRVAVNNSAQAAVLSTGAV